jgi:cytochrome c biogenesis protein CcdA
LTLGATVSAGFFTVFGGLGLLISAIGIATANKTLMPASPWTAAGLGALVVFLGFLTLFKQDFSLAAPFERLAAQLQRSQAAGESLVFYYFYGLGYAIASCGCTLPVFVTVFTWALSRGLTDGLLVFSAYAWGMTSMMLLLSLLTVYAKELLHRYVRVLVPWIQRLAGIIMIVAGSYLIYDQLIVSQIIRF